MQRFSRASLVALAGMVGCGIDALGTGARSDDGGVTPSDAQAPLADSGAPNADANGTADADAPLATCKDLPATWGLVAVVTGADPCPAGYEGGTTELREGATTRADTCTCGCTLTTQPTCTRGAAGATYDTDNSNSCGLTSSYAWNPAAGGGCSTDMWPGSWTTNHDWKFSAPARTGGTCTSAAQKHTERLDFAKQARACVPTAGCDGAPAIAAPAQRCVISAGDVVCPSGTFTKRSVMAKTFDVVCATTCGCAVEGACTGGTMTFYAGAGCTGGSFAMAANGTCVSSPGTGSIASYKYTATLNGAGCSASGTSAATAAITSSATICCE